MWMGWGGVGGGVGGGGGVDGEGGGETGGRGELWDVKTKKN